MLLFRYGSETRLRHTREDWCVAIHCDEVDERTMLSLGKQDRVIN